ncbi:MAG: putative MarR-family transcriptional regulator [Mycobacterium sp.]|nr:putative MarR-family transcriptional regulator [Mycobacterium sp.]
MTRTFGELQLAGLITRRTDEHDRRAAILTLTEQGREVLFRDMASRDAWLGQALETLSEAEVEILRVAAELMDQLAETTLTRPVEYLAAG